MAFSSGMFGIKNVLWNFPDNETTKVILTCFPNCRINNMNSHFQQQRLIHTGRESLWGKTLLITSSFSSCYGNLNQRLSLRWEPTVEAVLCGWQILWRCTIVIPECILSTLIWAWSSRRRRDGMTSSSFKEIWRMWKAFCLQVCLRFVRNPCNEALRLLKTASSKIEKMKRVKD